MSERASKTRQRLAGQICCFCYSSLSPLPVWTRGERFCEKCTPRPHKVLLTFVPRHGRYNLGFLEEDARTSLGWHYSVDGEEELRELVKRGRGDLARLEHVLHWWGQGAIWLGLTAEQYRMLVWRRRNLQRRHTDREGRGQF